MMSTREPLEWHFKQLDHAVGLSFKSNFHFALVGHLLKVSTNNLFYSVTTDWWFICFKKITIFFYNKEKFRAIGTT